MLFRSTSVTNATLLANLASIFVTLAAWLLWRQRPRGEFLAGLGAALAGVFLLAGEVAPKGTRYTMWTCLAVQVAVGLAGAIVRSSTDGRAGSVLAFGVLVPMLGIGLNGWWASRDGAFPPRTEGK